MIFDLLHATGIRAGELLALQIGDIDFYDNTISIVRRHDNVDDPRKKQPVVKTRERIIPVSDLVINRLRDYIMDERINVEPARKHPYVFVTHKQGRYYGQPISNSTFLNRILRTVTDVHPELLSGVTRHGFRHYFNYKLSKMVDAINKAAKLNPDIKPLNFQMEIDLRKHLCGWASNETASTYNLRHIREEAD